MAERTFDPSLIARLISNGIESLRAKGAYIKTGYDVYATTENTFHIIIPINFPETITYNGIEYDYITFELFTPEEVWEDKWEFFPDAVANINPKLNWISRGIARILWTIWQNISGIEFKKYADGHWDIESKGGRIIRTMKSRASSFVLKPTTHNSYTVIYE